jgi:threonine dehydrogenase-like Zn-dependent dehydrogenase
MFIDEGDILGHEPMGIVEEVGPDVTHIKAGDRVVIPFDPEGNRVELWDIHRPPSAGSDR